MGNEVQWNRYVQLSITMLMQSDGDRERAAPRPGTAVKTPAWTIAARRAHPPYRLSHNFARWSHA